MVEEVIAQIQLFLIEHDLLSNFNFNQIIRQQKLYVRVSFQVQVILEERLYVAYMSSGK